VKTILIRFNFWKMAFWVIAGLGLSSCSADVNLKLLQDLLLNNNPVTQEPDNRSFHMNTAVKNSGNFQFFFVVGDPVEIKSSGDYTFQPTSIW
jgi:hypothetical protein